ncbi:hypothetical protein EKL99_08040 [Flavobacterium sp. ZB4P23]|uniref:Uncharacterized protein n=1 Tax=Flavobacterium bomense TaxID=2497483 RepID=A0A3S0QAJ6_9FLAO|nr:MULTISPECIES: hypothetical protein [Flavobacterium]RTY70546.1 hypothetical protein EKL95_04125 [Flavobacterium sp. LB2P53]RTY76140.1 hypothetical protein EKL96_01220 [Flavobacterium sp. LS1R10]RTY82647.1 hypothetical protein EKL99_08040 [Flavobacterium sp. ZB4P23]RTY89920.1 hypothetical protein EKM01_12470 [Flavobacterium sp. RSP46]RTZ08205.1 hypothetical protein EKL98_02485 [Flavobacterium bomense]
MESKFSGMTVNERLYVGGLINDFDNALEQKNVEGIKAVLKKVALNEDSIFEMLISLGLDA